MARTLISSVFSFPRPDLESHWWHRLAKILIFVSVLVAVVIAIRWSNDFFKPYPVYSFESSFSKYSSTYRIKDCSIKTLCGEDVDFVVSAYELSDTPGKDDHYDHYNYVHDREVKGESTYSIFQELENEGVFSNLQAVDLQNNFYGSYYKPLLVLVPILWYLFMIHVVYRILAYILAGKKKTSAH